MRLSFLVPCLLLFAALSPGASLAGAPVHRSCELLPHGSSAGANDGCTLSHHVDERLYANVTVTGGTIDIIEIDVRGPAGERIVVICTELVVTASCITPIQRTGVPGDWSVTARIVAADPLGLLFVGGFDTYARLDVTFI